MTVLDVESMVAAFPPPFARFGRTLHLAAPGALPCEKLFAAEALTGAAAVHAATLGPCSAPNRAQVAAALSLWSQYYLLALVPAAVAAVLAAGRDLPVAACGMGVVLAPSGLPERMCLPHAGCPASVRCPMSRLTPLLREHLQTLATALDKARLPQRVFWSNAAHVLLWSLRVVDAPEGACGAVSHALTRPDWVDGLPNPFAPVLAADGRSRRVCCLRHRLPGVEACSGCPAAPPQAAVGARSCRNRSSASPSTSLGAQ